MKVKEYLTTDELITTIKNKGIIILNEEKVKEILKQHNYYIIMGYKSLFIENNKYKNNVSFENIYSLYRFDRQLKILLLNALLDIESIVKNAIVNHFCNTYGYKEDNYLKKDNYNISHKYLNKTIAVFKKQIEEKKDTNIAVDYYINRYGFVPLWVMCKVLSFGLIKELYAIMKKEDETIIKDSICNFNDTKIKHLYIQLQLIVDKRNKIAHDEILFNDIHKRIILPKTKEHSKFNLSGNSGLNDTLGLFISIKNILPKQDFNKLIDDLTNLINNYINDNNVITKEELLKEMHLPLNYEILKW